MCVEELNQALYAHFLLWIEVFFHRQIYAETVLVDLIQDHAVKVVFVALLDCLLQVDFVGEIVRSELKLLSQLL